MSVMMQIRKGDGGTAVILSPEFFVGGDAINTISILGSGWLGLPLAERFVTQGYRLKISTTSPDRLSKLAALPGEACIVDIK